MPYRLCLNVTLACLTAPLLALGGTLAQAADIRVLLIGPRSGEVHAALMPVGAQQWQAEPLQTIRANAQLRFTQVPPGDYAVQLFVDSNGNGLLDLSPRGRPREPVGFSNDPSLVNGVPDIQAAAFKHGDQPLELIIRLRQPPGAAAGSRPTR